MNDPNNYWTSAPGPAPVEFPKMMFHETKDAKRVNSREEQDALGPEWSEKYSDHPRKYPKMKFKLKAEPKEGEPHYDTLVVDTPEDESKAGAGWSDTLPPPPKAKTAEEPKHEHNDKKK